MMKFVCALVALLHLCSSYKSNRTLNGEIIMRLDVLNQLYNDNKNITLPDMMQVPSGYMRQHAASCVSVFVRELRHLLNNVTIHGESKHILQELKANLRALDPHEQTDHRCKMIPAEDSLLPFNAYRYFLRNLNTSKKR